MGPAPAVAAVRLAVRRTLAGCEPGSTVLVACSGGADSLALLAATGFEARRNALRVVGLTIDHGLQPGSAGRATAVVGQMRRLGAEEARAVRVRVDPAGLGVEAAARVARYDALQAAAAEHGADLVLLGHTRDDQAESVLLGLTRGSGGRSLAGMPPVRGLFHRPLLELTREQTEEACRAEGIEFWSDPHNTDPRFTRSRIRHRVLPVLEQELGPGVAAALARTAEMVRADTDALDRIAADWFAAHRRLEPGPAGAADDEAAPVGSGPANAAPRVALEVEALGELDAAVRLRVLRLAAVEAGCPPGELFRVHVLAVDELVGAYTGQRRIELPGPVHAVRSGPVLRFSRP